MNFSNKVVLITGASNGIGETTAVHMAQLGAKLALTGRNKKNLDKVSDRCEKISKIKPFTIIAELLCDRHVKRIIDETINHYKCLHVLVNNAGGCEFGSMEKSTLDQYDRIFDLNVRAVYHLTMLAVPYLIREKGTIVNVSCSVGLKPSTDVVYSMSKSALDQMTRALALELAEKGVRVNSVNPDVVKTGLFQRYNGMDEDTLFKYLESSKNNNGFGRNCEPDEVAKAIAFLAGDESTFVTGVNLPVDGGRNIMCPR